MRRKRDFIRYAYPVTAAYLTVMVTATLVLILTGSSTLCRC